jgi:plastocyanin
MKYAGTAVTMALLMTITLLSNTCSAEEYVVTEKDISFHPIIKVVKPGDIIKFQNNDNVTHNIVSFTKDFQFDLGKFKPGMTKSVQFKHKGVVDVQCTIHPEMKMTIFVF